MDYLIIAIITLLVAAFTFLSGFGLGTLVLPVFIFFFPVDMAIASTAVVHLCDNIFKSFLIGRKANFGVMLQFAIPAAAMAVVGALLLNRLNHLPVLWSYRLMQHTFAVTPVKVVIAALMGLFAFLELNPRFRALRLPEKYVPLGGMLSGFFGGLSGHQGALRSAFLIRLGLEKEVYIATTVLASLFVDIPRLTVYGLTFYGHDLASLFQQHQVGLIITAILSAMCGSILGARLIQKVTLDLVKTLVGVLLIIYAIALGAGFI
jgi:uncharacterized membrane protein YfcA